jgi:hypothetical protein
MRHTTSIRQKDLKMVRLMPMTRLSQGKKNQFPLNHHQITIKHCKRMVKDQLHSEQHQINLELIFQSATPLKPLLIFVQKTDVTLISDKELAFQDHLLLLIQSRKPKLILFQLKLQFHLLIQLKRYQLLFNQLKKRKRNIQLPLNQSKKSKSQ